MLPSPGHFPTARSLKSTQGKRLQRRTINFTVVCCSHDPVSHHLAQRCLGNQIDVDRRVAVNSVHASLNKLFRSSRPGEPSARYCMPDISLQKLVEVEVSESARELLTKELDQEEMRPPILPPDRRPLIVIRSNTGSLRRYLSTADLCEATASTVSPVPQSRGTLQDATTHQRS
jgi:hypothetical protein